MTNFESRSNHISALTSMRGIAAVLVMLFHVRYGFVNVSAINMQLFGMEFLARGYLWVDFFFMLSGYVLALRYGGEVFSSGKSYFQFVGVRLARVYPLHLITFSVFVVYVWIQKGSAYLGANLESFFANLFLLHGWYGVFSENWNYPSWSLSSEWAAYLMFPFLCVGFRVICGRLARSLFALAFLLLTFGLYVHLFHSDSLDIAYGFGWRRCLFSFAVGMTLRSLAQGFEYDRAKSTFDTAALVLFGVLIAQLQYQAPDFYFIPTGAALLFCLSLSWGPFTKLLQWAPFVFLGEISFSIYMWHAIVVRAFGDFYSYLGKPVWGVEVSSIALALVVVFTVGLSALSYRLIEQNLFKRTRKWVLQV